HHRHHRHHPAHRHREKERHHDDRLRPRGRTQRRQESGGGHFPGLPAAVSPHHHDHHGGHVGRPAAGPRCGHGRRATPAAGHHHCRWADLQPDADVVHHAGRLLVPRPLATLVYTAAPWTHTENTRGGLPGTCREWH